MKAFSPQNPLVLVGAGKMGGAMLAGWLDKGLDPAATIVIEPSPDPEDDALSRVSVVGAAPSVAARAIILAVKPHQIVKVLPTLAPCRTTETLVISVAAGRPLDSLGPPPVVRVMPNTPASIGEGALVAIGKGVSDGDVAVTNALLTATGKVWWIEDEALMDAVTAVSGSGPAYLFHLAECLGEAGRAAGLPDELAADLARQTVVGSAALLGRSPLDPGTLRANVTSKGGTTAAALGVLRDSGALSRLMTEAVTAAAKRSKELGA
ncbi:MAG: pyrroline-5-carboxylate reductase [Pseudomonadota bacterium]